MFSSLCINGFLQFLQTAVFTVGYISGVQLFPEPLSSEEERICLEKLSTGDEEARNLLIERNLRLVAHVAKNIVIQMLIRRLDFYRNYWTYKGH
ncbi:MAG: hypothetical protein V8R51_05800 [Clostridia bacterium]